MTIDERPVAEGSSEREEGPAAEGSSESDERAAAGPRVWLLVGEKRGDNAQIRNLARLVGWPWTEKQVRVRPEWAEAKPSVRPSLDHVDREGSDPLEGPWPELVVTAGRRLASVALWIRQASGGRTRLVLIGKPRGRLADFDLVVAAAHYVLPDAPNVVRHGLPLMDVDHEALAEAKKAWVDRLTPLPRPLTALLVGGPTGGLKLDVETTRRLLEATRETVAARGGSLHVVTSRRTPSLVNDFLRAEKSADERLYVYDANDAAAENPYQGLLALADHFVVTTDSLSMMVEVARIGRPLSLFPLPRDAGPLERGLETIGLLPRFDPRVDACPGGGVVSRTLAALGRPIHSRDLSAIPRWLVAGGHASWLGDPVIPPAPLRDEGWGPIVERIRGLVRP